MRNRNRRGVLLLLVLALLATFALIAVAFVILAQQENVSARRMKQKEEAFDSPPKDCDQMANVVTRGSFSLAGTPTTSAITWQSLLEGIYGYETIGSLNHPAVLGPVTPICNGQLLEFNLPSVPPDPLTLSTPTIDPYQYVGCVVTMLTGRCAGRSSRIVGIDPTPGNQTAPPQSSPSQSNYAYPAVQVLAFEGGGPLVSGNFQPGTAYPAPGDWYIVNGFPYSGLGFGFAGYLPSSGSKTQPVPNLTTAALQPNLSPALWSLMGLTGGTGSGVIYGGVNVDYTAPDYATPPLALELPNPITGGTFVPIPSFHRSDLMAYWHIQLGGSLNSSNSASTGLLSPANVATLRNVMFRPNWIDNPSFTGSNPTGSFTPGSAHFNPMWDGQPYQANGTPSPNSWDVDCSGGGVPDAVWVDPGLPVRFTSDGHPFKALMAVKCVDMDGRLNLNAHGNLAQTQQNYYAPISTQGYVPLTSFNPGMGTTPPQQAYCAGQVSAPPSPGSPFTPERGLGMSPAEVNLLPLLRNMQSPTNFYWNSYQSLLTGGFGYMGRYGPPAQNGPPSGVGGAMPGTNGIGSVLTANNAFPYNGFPINGFPGGNYWQNFQKTFDAYGSPPDTQGMGTYLLDRAGRPLYISLGGQITNGPHDIDLTLRAAHAVDLPVTPDNAFGLAEYEAIARMYDRDATMLPQRLINLTSTGNGSLLAQRRAEFAVEDSWVPVAPAVLPLDLRAMIASNQVQNTQGTITGSFIESSTLSSTVTYKSYGGLQPLVPYFQSRHPVDMLTAKYVQSGGNIANHSVLNQMRLHLLPWEIMQGLRMDLNRPFGAGPSSQGGSLVYGGVPAGAPTIPDQPGTTREQVKQFTTAAGGSVTAAFNYAADGGVATQVTDSLAARQLYARHLYVMALALTSTASILTDLQKANPAATPDDAVRVIAQWAVNVVAYRDHNGIMIPFPYDTNPFAGNAGSSGVYWNPDNTALHTVWGCKRPELLITETLAFHDRRTQDRNDESFNKNKPGNPPGRTMASYTTNYTPPPKPGTQDPSFNSAYRPQGSFFLELYNPWTILEPRTTDLGPVPSAGVNNGVQLNKVSAAVGGKTSPVWRIIIVDPSSNVNSVPLNKDELPDADNPIVTNRPVIERVAYFVNVTGLTIPSDGKVSYYPSTVSSTTPIVVLPSGYAVVGSGDPNQQNRSYIGFESGKTLGSPATTRMVTLNQADLTDARVVRNTNDPAPPTGTPIPQVIAIDTAYGAAGTRRMSVSEPVSGYTQYEVDPVTSKPANPSPGTGQYTTVLDIPVDEMRSLGLNGLPKETFMGLPIWNWLNTNATIPGFRIIYLQRLADPTRPFVPDVPGTPGYVANPQQWNPYRTVDAMTVDLTTFNGMTTEKDPSSPPAGTYYFEARQRGERNYTPLAQKTEMNIWRQEPAIKGLATPTVAAAPMANWQPAAGGWAGGGAAATASMTFPAPLNQTLGYLNQPFQPPVGTKTAGMPGDPQYPFPWLYWSYRPFNNEYELLLVPWISSSRLLARNAVSPRSYYNYVDASVRARTDAAGGGYTPQDVYDSSVVTGAATDVPYPHLMNLFESGPSSAINTVTTPGTSTFGVAAQLHRVLAYVGVPSRFANTQLQIRADLASTSTSPASWIHTPFNRVSRYREPGRINLNTFTSADVFFGMLNTYNAPFQTNSQLNPILYDKIVRSRRGDGTGPPLVTPVTSSTPTQATALQSLQNMLAINPSVPSRFMGAFRTPGGEYLTSAWYEAAHENSVGILRPDPDPAQKNRPLFEVDDGLMGPLLESPTVATSSPTGNAATPDQFSVLVGAQGAPTGVSCACADFNRNPTFRYQTLQKLGNAYSTHSNVFAIWITVGYFEAIPTAVSAVHPDGYQLGQELGSDSGDIVRHRAFYIFDRSIPMGFLRGLDVNQANGFLLKRIIE